MLPWPAIRPPAETVTANKAESPPSPRPSQTGTLKDREEKGHRDANRPLAALRFCFHLSNGVAIP